MLRHQLKLVPQLTGYALRVLMTIFLQPASMLRNGQVPETIRIQVNGRSQLDPLRRIRSKLLAEL